MKSACDERSPPHQRDVVGGHGILVHGGKEAEPHRQYAQRGEAGEASEEEM